MGPAVRLAGREGDSRRRIGGDGSRVERRQRVEREEGGLRERAGVGWHMVCGYGARRRDLRGVVGVGRGNTRGALEGVVSGGGSGGVAGGRVAVRTWAGTG